MPVKKCQVKGKKGFKFGDAGKCYKGKSGKAKAANQGRAIKASENKKKK